MNPGFDRSGDSQALRIGEPRGTGGPLPVPPGRDQVCINRVVLVTGRYPGRGGVEVAVTNLASAFLSIGISVDVVTLFGAKQPESESPAAVIFDRRPDLQEGSVTGGGAMSVRALVRLPLLTIKRLDRRRGLRKLARLVPARSPGALVVVTSPRVATYLADAGVLSRDDRPPVVVQYHIPFEAQVSLEGVGLPVSTALNVDAAVALSDADAARYRELLSVPCYRIPNPAPARSDWSDGSVERRAKEQRVVALCRLAGEKQLDQMIDIFLDATATPQLGKYTLEIYGEGPERPSLERKIAGLGEHGGRVHLRDWVADPATALRGAAVLLSTSRFEAFGMSILDAARAGVPSVAYGCSDGVSDLVRDLGGVLVDPGDRVGFADRLRALLADEDERRRRGVAARSGSARYGSGVVIAAWQELAARLCDTSVAERRYGEEPRS